MSNAPFDAALTRRAASSTANIGSLTATGPRAASPVDQRQLAVVAVVAHQAIDFGERRERFVDRGAARRLVAAEGLHLDRGAHHVAVLVALLRLRVHDVASQQRGPMDARPGAAWIASPSSERHVGCARYLQPQPPLWTP